MSGVFNSYQDYEGNVKPSSVEKAGYEPELFAGRITEIPSNMGMRVSYDSNANPQYIGYAPRGLAEGVDGWLLQKFTYNASNDVTKREIAYGNWTNRASESYS